MLSGIIYINRGGKMSLKMSVNEIIKMKPRTIDKATVWCNLEHLGEIFEDISYANNSNLSENMKKRVVSKDFMIDKCCDCRTRTLEVLFIDDKPVTIHQYIGKGYIQYLRILNKELLLELREDLLRDSDTKIDTVSLDEPIEIHGCNMVEPRVENGSIVSG